MTGRNVSRRGFLTGLGALGASLAAGALLEACGGAAAPSPSGAAPSSSSAAAKPASSAGSASAPAASAAPGSSAGAASQPIKIGVPLSLTGPLTVNGKEQQLGIQIAAAQLNNKMAGRPFQLVVLDDESTPEAALRVTRQLIESSKVDVVVGYVNSAAGYSTRDLLHQAKKPTITMVASSGLTRQNKSPYVYRLMSSTLQWAYQPSQYLKDKLGHKRIIWWGADFAASHEGFIAAKQVFGSGLVKEIWTPLGTTDFSPYLGGINPSQADVVAAAVFGNDGVKLAEQYRQSPLFGKLPLFGYASFTSDEVLGNLSSQSVMEGVQSCYMYCESIDNAANKSLVQLFTEKVGRPPGDYGYAAYLSLNMMAKAVELVSGDVSNPDKVAEALGKAKLENTPTGTQSFDANHGWVTDFFWRKVVMKNGKAANALVDRLPQVVDPVKEFPKV